MQEDLSAPSLKESQSLGHKAGRLGLQCFSRLVVLPGLSKLFKNTFLGACHHVSELVKRGRSKEAIDFTLHLLKSDQFRNRKTFRWWYLMRQAISLAQDYQLGGFDPLKEQVSSMMDLIQAGPQPRTGYDAAYCFVGLGLWSFQMGDTSKAVHFVKKAIEADTEWGYPEYLMGWLGLFDQTIDPTIHFVNALQFNWSFFHRMNRDPICQQHPEIIRQVRQKVLHLTDSNSKVGSGAFKA